MSGKRRGGGSTMRNLGSPCLDCGRLTQRRDRVCPRCVTAQAQVRASTSMRWGSTERWSKDMAPLTGYDPRSDCVHPRPVHGWCLTCGRRLQNERGGSE